MQITILGAGAMGSFFGGLLAESGNSVTLLDINEVHLNTVAQNGLCLETNQGKRYVQGIKVSTPKDAVGTPELLIVFTKSLHTRAALDSIKQIIGADTQVLTLQNGLGNLEILSEFVVPENILIGSTTWPADAVSSGHVASHGVGAIRMMNAKGELSSAAKKVVQVLDDAGLFCQADANVWASIWEKVAFNCALNCLCAVTGCSVDQLDLVTDGQHLALNIVNEVLGVATKSGISVDVDKTHAQVINAINHHHGHLPSMLQDLIAMRPTEINALNGAVVEKARALGLAVPYTESLLCLVHLIEARILASKSSS